MPSFKNLSSRCFTVCLGFVLALLVAPVFAGWTSEREEFNTSSDEAVNISSPLQATICRAATAAYEACVSHCDGMTPAPNTCPADDLQCQTLYSNTKAMHYAVCRGSCGVKPAC